MRAPKTVQAGSRLILGMPAVVLLAFTTGVAGASLSTEELLSKVVERAQEAKKITPQHESATQNSTTH